MKLAIVQPYFFPYIGYLQLIDAVDKFVVYDDVHFMKKRWINRNYILIAGQPSFIIVPLRKASQNKLIKDVEIAGESGWRAKMLRSVELAYKKAPFFNDGFAVVHEVISRDEPKISNLAVASLKAVARYLDIKTEFVDTSTVYDNSQLRAQERILNICEIERASAYINPIGGVPLYSKKAFNDKNISLNFLKPNPPLYKQYGADFTPSLSIIDVLMFNSRDKIKEYLLCYELV
ncbi:WbqC family protein [Candidatus Uhrbacteria bacterium]|nr:WbqC family protein [Candidatus Uhrbacteria bacterium]